MRNNLIDFYIDNYVWWFLQLYFLPYRMPEYGSEVDKWISMYTLNGAKSNLCQPGWLLNLFLLYLIYVWRMFYIFCFGSHQHT